MCLHFSLALENGLVAETTQEDGEPLEFVMGDGTFIQGLEIALLGLKPGDKQSLKIEPEVAFGLRDEANIHAMARSVFPPDMALAPDQVVGFSTPRGDEIPGTVVELNEEQVMVDFNHPLAGHELTFDVEILSVENAS